MQATVDKGVCIGGIWITLLVIYLALGLVFDARWLKLKWGRWGGGVVPLSRLSRVLALLIWAIMASLCFAHAFHFHQHTMEDILLPAFLLLLALLVLSGLRDSRNFKQKR